MTLLTRLDFAAYYACSLHGTPEAVAPGLAVYEGLRGAESKALQGITRRVREALYHDRFSEFLGHDVAVIPVPPHKPRGGLAGPWSARSICEALHEAKLAADLMPYLIRTAEVARSCRAAPAARPSAREHLDTIGMLEKLTVHDRITVVDDVVSTGATLLAAASRVQQRYPHAEVKAFAALRLLDAPAQAVDLHAPVIGEISLVGEDRTERVP